MIKTQMKDGTLTIGLSGEIDHHTAKTLREEADEAIVMHAPKRTVLDFGQVTFMDSSGVGLIMGRSRLCSAWNCALGVKGLSERDRKIVLLSGLRDLVEIED